MSAKQLPLRPNVCMLVYNAKGKLLLGERCNESGHWQFPQGGAEAKYSLRENVMRELKEELGIKRRHVGKVRRLRSRHEYEWRSPPPYGKGRWRGQAQSFWLVEFIGEDSDIDLESFKEPEFQAWRWCSVSEVKRRAPAYRVKGYSGALTEFLTFKREVLATRTKRSPKAKAKRG